MAIRYMINYSSLDVDVIRRNEKDRVQEFVWKTSFDTEKEALEVLVQVLEAQTAIFKQEYLENRFLQESVYLDTTEKERQRMQIQKDYFTVLERKEIVEQRLRELNAS